ncbi:T9SS type A sorting domain-containing protein [Bacteroides salyersiae]|nr:T9SS type A sorting domain-containing protein [Bacteroides salyersiae]
MATSIYPNPTDGPVNIESEETIHSIRVFDINGRTILNMNNLNTNKETINLYEQPGGVYIIKINGMTYRIIRK